MKNVGVRPARHPAGGFIESRKAGLDELILIWVIKDNEKCK